MNGYHGPCTVLTRERRASSQNDDSGGPVVDKTSRKHFLELAYSKCCVLEKKCIQQLILYTLTVIVKAQPCTYLAELLPLTPKYCSILCKPDG